MFDLSKFLNAEIPPTRFAQHLHKLEVRGLYVSNIISTVDAAVRNIRELRCRSFVIYGEPQSGKTEMMIGLCARLLDEGTNQIIVLVNDSVQLLQQNLGRFQRSGISPTPRSLADICDSAVSLEGTAWIIVVKKNSKDLRKLLEKLTDMKGLAVIDDEADHATPNAKINEGLRSTINGLISDLVKNDGVYIGVTATPARLDLNNTLGNDNERWLYFPPHPKYHGQETFFPTNGDKPQYLLNLLSDDVDEDSALLSQQD